MIECIRFVIYFCATKSKNCFDLTTEQEKESILKYIFLFDSKIKILPTIVLPFEGLFIVTELKLKVICGIR